MHWWYLMMFCFPSSKTAQRVKLWEITTVRQNIAHLVLNSIILLEIPPTTRTRTPSRATLTRWQRFRKKSGATAPNRATVPLDDVEMMHEGRATLPISTPITSSRKKKKRPRSPPRSTPKYQKLMKFFFTRPLSKLNSFSILLLYNSFPHAFKCKVKFCQLCTTPPARRDKIKIWFDLTVSGDGTTLKKTSSYF